MGKHYDLLNKISSINKIPTFFSLLKFKRDILDRMVSNGYQNLLHPNMVEMFDLIKDYINHDQNFENHIIKFSTFIFEEIFLFKILSKTKK